MKNLPTDKFLFQINVLIDQYWNGKSLIGIIRFVRTFGTVDRKVDLNFKIFTKFNFSSNQQKLEHKLKAF